MFQFELAPRVEARLSKLREEFCPRPGDLECGGSALCFKGSASSVCIAPALDGQTCNDTNGPPCLFPAKCVNTDDAGNGVCVVPNPADCF